MSRATTDQVVINEKIFIVNKWPLEPKWLSQKMYFLNITLDHWQHLMPLPSYRRLTPTYFSTQTRKASRIRLFIHSCCLHKMYGKSIFPIEFVNSLNYMIISYTICSVLQSIIIFCYFIFKSKIKPSMYLNVQINRCFLDKINFYCANTFLYLHMIMGFWLFIATNENF